MSKKNNEEKPTLGSYLELIGIIVFVIVTLVFFPHTVVWNIVVLLLMLSLLITIHEFGHFIAAKKFGVHVYEFAIGMGPKVISFKRKGDPTIYSLRALPIGGYNQLAGEVMEDDKELPKESFMCNKPKHQRIIILVSGVLMNFLLAIVFLFVMSCIWGTTNQDTVIKNVLRSSEAEKAGIQAGDKILKMNNHKASDIDSLQVVSLLKNKKNTNTYLIEHKDGSKSTYTLEIKNYVISKSTGEIVSETSDENTFDKIIEDNNLNKDDYVEKKLAGFQFDTKSKKGFAHSIKYAFSKFKNTACLMFRIIYYLITGKLGLDALSGPVGMYTVVDAATNVGSTSYGLYNLIYLTAYISINLGVMNILPFPAFDGGQLMFVVYEIITRKKGNADVEAVINLIGFILIFSLMILITFKDIFKLIG